MCVCVCVCVRVRVRVCALGGSGDTLYMVPMGKFEFLVIESGI